MAKHITLPISREVRLPYSVTSSSFLISEDDVRDLCASVTAEVTAITIQAASYLHQIPLSFINAMMQALPEQVDMLAFYCDLLNGWSEEDFIAFLQNIPAHIHCLDFGWVNYPTYFDPYPMLAEHLPATVTSFALNEIHYRYIRENNEGEILRILGQYERMMTLPSLRVIQLSGDINKIASTERIQQLLSRIPTPITTVSFFNVEFTLTEETKLRLAALPAHLTSLTFRRSLNSFFPSGYGADQIGLAEIIAVLPASLCFLDFGRYDLAYTDYEPGTSVTQKILDIVPVLPPTLTSLILPHTYYALLVAEAKTHPEMLEPLMRLTQLYMNAMDEENPHHSPFRPTFTWEDHAKQWYYEHDPLDCEILIAILKLYLEAHPEDFDRAIVAQFLKNIGNHLNNDDAVSLASLLTESLELELALLGSIPKLSDDFRVRHAQLNFVLMAAKKETTHPITTLDFLQFPELTTFELASLLSAFKEHHAIASLSLRGILQKCSVIELIDILETVASIMPTLTSLDLSDNHLERFTDPRLLAVLVSLIPVTGNIYCRTFLENHPDQEFQPTSAIKQVLLTAYAENFPLFIECIIRVNLSQPTSATQEMRHIIWLLLTKTMVTQLLPKEPEAPDFFKSKENVLSVVSPEKRRLYEEEYPDITLATPAVAPKP